MAAGVNKQIMQSLCLSPSMGNLVCSAVPVISPAWLNFRARCRPLKWSHLLCLRRVVLILAGDQQGWR